MRTRQFELLRPREIVAERNRCPAVYMPIAPLEWHGPHMPMGTDPVWAHTVALRAAEISGGVVLPPLYWGCDEPQEVAVIDALGLPPEERFLGVDFPHNSLKSHYCKEEVFGLMVRERLDWLIANGYNVAAVINGHGGRNQVATTFRLAEEYTATQGLKVLCGWPSPVDESGVLRWGHATSEEASLWMIVQPDCLDLSELPPAGEPLLCREYAVIDIDTFSGNPTPDRTARNDPRTEASVEFGNAKLDLAAAQLAERVSVALGE
jgi:creatinine amidohydrolase